MEAMLYYPQKLEGCSCSFLCNTVSCTSKYCLAPQCLPELQMKLIRGAASPGNLGRGGTGAHTQGQGSPSTDTLQVRPLTNRGCRLVQEKAPTPQHRLRGTCPRGEVTRAPLLSSASSPTSCFGKDGASAGLGAAGSSSLLTCELHFRRLSGLTAAKMHRATFPCWENGFPFRPAATCPREASPGQEERLSSQEQQLLRQLLANWS